MAVAPAELTAALDEHRRSYPAGDFDAVLRARGLTNEEWRTELTESLLLDKLVGQVVGERGRVSEMEIDAYYAAHRADFDRPDQVRARQIVVADQASGEKVLAELRKGAEFAEVAKRVSLSPDAAQGGDLGFFGRDEMPPEFDPVFHLPVGKLSPWSRVTTVIICFWSRRSGRRHGSAARRPPARSGGGSRRNAAKRCIRNGCRSCAARPRSRSTGASSKRNRNNPARRMVPTMSVTRIVLLAGMICLAAMTPARAETVSRIAAVVNGDIITTYELDQALNAQLAKSAKQPSPAQLGALRKELLSRLIEEELVQQRIRTLRLQVSDEEVENAILDVQKQNQLTREQLEQAIQSQGLTFAAYRENLRKQLLRYKLIGQEVRSKVDVSEREVRDYYRAHLEEYRLAPTVTLSAVTFPVPEKAGAAEREAIRNAAREALDRLRQGESLEPVARQLP